MPWYHFTGIEDFYSIVLDEALLSFYEKLKKRFPGKLRVIDNLKSDDENEDFRRRNVFLTQDRERLRAESKGKDVRLCFESDREPNYHGLLVVPELSLEFLVEVGAVKNYVSSARLILQNVHDGKYRRIPLRVMS